MLVARFLIVFGCLVVAKSAHLRDPKLHLPPLVPFKIDKVELKPSDKLTLILRNVELYGLDTMELTDAELDLKNKHIKIGLFAKQLKVLAVYNIEGQILVIPISGEGHTDLQFGDGSFEYSFDYDIITKKDGKKYVSNIRPKINFKIAKAHYKLENLFNGNKELGESTNKLLNENSQEVLKDFGVAISEVINSVATRLFESVVNKVPYDEIFLP